MKIIRYKRNLMAQLFDINTIYIIFILNLKIKTNSFYVFFTYVNRVQQRK